MSAALEAARREAAEWRAGDALAVPEAAGGEAWAAGEPEAGVSDATLGALLAGAAPDADADADADAELWVRRLAERVARLEALNVGGMLAAAAEAGGARLAARLAAGAGAAAALAARRERAAALARAGPQALLARSGAARADAGARALLAELQDLYAWLDAPALRDLDSLSEVSLATSEGRARALEAGAALRAALRAGPGGAGPGAPARRRLAAVRERLRRLARARDALAAATARHLNNLLIHLGNEAGAAAPAPAPATAPAPAPRAHHADLLPYAPFMRWLKDMDEKAYDALVKVYAGTWARVYERELRAACEAARAAPPPAAAAAPDTPLDAVLTVVENVCNAEQDFCMRFFFLDADAKGDGGDGSRSERSDEGARRGGGGGGPEARRLQAELFPALEPELLALVAHLEKQPYGAMRALACAGRRALGGAAGAGGAGAGAEGEARWARAALAAVAVAAKRGADRLVAERIAALGEAVRAAARRPKAGLLGFLREFEELAAACEGIFGAGGRRADLERWYGALGAAMLAAVGAASHPRTPRAVLQLENYHRLGALLAARRAPALDALRRDARARYEDALRQYVTRYFGRPLDKLNIFFEGVAEAVAGGAREDEVCFRAAYSKHELRRLLAMYPAHEVRKSLHRLYRTVEKQLSEEGGLLQVVWRAMQEEFIAQHRALQARIAACYPGAGLALPLTTQDILDAFSDIAREH